MSEGVGAGVEVVDACRGCVEAVCRGVTTLSSPHSYSSPQQQTSRWGSRWGISPHISPQDRLAGWRRAFLAGGGLLGGGLLALAAAAPSPPYFRTTRRLAWSESNRSSCGERQGERRGAEQRGGARGLWRGWGSRRAVSAVTPSHLNAGLAVDACRTYMNMMKSGVGHSEYT